jgi:glycosyltransferase involved in cell wall biosynthesis/MoaA/NifB/PqqE/SkfB family radical SAM enzyme
MHILKIIHGYPPNYNAGSEVYSQSICNQLSRQNKVSIFTREENPYTPDFTIRRQKQNDKLDFYFVNNPQGKDGYRHQLLDQKFAELIAEIKPDIAHIGHLNHLSTGIVDELNKQHIPIVFTLHDFWLMCPRGQFLTRSIAEMDNFRVCSGQQDQKCASDCYRVYFSGREAVQDQEMGQWSKWVHQRMIETKSIIDKVDIFIAPSNYLRTRFIRDFQVPEDKIIYLDYGFPTEYLTTSDKSEGEKTFTFGYIGTHNPAKGVNQLIEAFKQIGEPAKLKIYGRSNGQSTEALKALAAGSRNEIEFSGEYINHNLADDVFSKVDCIVVPSIWAENSPLVIHEAQACKIPVITADFGGMKEYVQHKVNGLLFKHRDVDSLAAQMKFAVANPQLLKEYGERGYLYATDGNVPDIQTHSDELVKIYERFINTKKLWRITIDTNPEDCNLKCVMCEEHSPYSDFIPKLYQETGVKRRRMKFETVEEIFRQAERMGVKQIIPSTMGEPLLYKGIEGIFALSRKHHIKINLTTNGTFPRLSVKEWSKLIIPNTTDVKISWNGATKETAEKVMLGIDFEKSVSKVKEFIKCRDEHFACTGYFCRLTFQLTFMQNNMHELADIIRLAASLGVDRVKGHQLWAHFEEIKTLSMKDSMESVAMWNEYVKLAYEAQEQYRKPNGEKVILENIIPLSDNEDNAVPEDYECPFLAKELWVSATGNISPCCAPDNLRKLLGDFGNIGSTTLEEVLKSPVYTELVSNYKTRPICRTCNMRKPAVHKDAIQLF